MEKRSVLVILICVMEGQYFEDEGLGGWVVHEDELQGLFVAESDALDGHVHRITFNATRYYRNYRHQAYSIISKHYNTSMAITDETQRTAFYSETAQPIANVEVLPTFSTKFLSSAYLSPIIASKSGCIVVI